MTDDELWDLAGPDLRARIMRDMAKLRQEKPEFFAKALRRCERNVRRESGSKAAREHMARLYHELDAAEASLSEEQNHGQDHG
jgi:hypothetical protein